MSHSLTLGNGKEPLPESDGSLRLVLISALALSSLVLLTAEGRVIWLHLHGQTYLGRSSLGLTLGLVTAGLIAPIFLVTLLSTRPPNWGRRLLSLAPLSFLAAEFLFAVQLLDIEGLAESSWIGNPMWKAIHGGLSESAFWLNLLFVPFALILLSRRSVRTFLGKPSVIGCTLYTLAVACFIVTMATVQ